MNRRTFLATTIGASAAAANRRARIAAIITAYYRNPHADVFIGNMLRGFYWDGKPHTSELEIAAMHLEQTPANDIGRAEADHHGIPLKATVREAISPDLQGVALIGEHGDYPTNEKGQKLYPRYELMEQSSTPIAPIAELFRCSWTSIFRPIGRKPGKCSIGRAS